MAFEWNIFLAVGKIISKSKYRNPKKYQIINTAK